MFVTSPLQPGLDYTFIGIDKYAVAGFGFIGSVRTGSSRAPAGGDFYVDPSSMFHPEQRVEARV
jgi:hypothetical protein